MKIAIDGYEANVGQRLGSSQVAYELLKDFEKLDHQNEYTIFLPSSPRDDLPKKREGWKYQVLKPKRLWTYFALPVALFLRGSKFDLIFSPTHYIPRFSPIKRVATIFDLSFLHFPEMFTKKDLWQLKNWTKFSVENVNHIITISESTKKDLIKSYGLDSNKITIAYPGYDRDKFKVQRSPASPSEAGRAKFKVNEIRRKYKVEDNYIIYIGTIQPRKNLIRLMEAFAQLIKQEHLAGWKMQLHLRGGLQLVIVGKSDGEGRGGWMYEEILETSKRLGIEDRVKFLGFVPTEDLQTLLSGAQAFVQPSLYEGFGITVVEAMAAGVPVIVSNVSSLPEVVGDAGLLVDPYSVDQIEQAIRTLTTDKKLREKYVKLGLIQSQKFSWDKMAKQVLKVFTKVST